MTIENYYVLDLLDENCKILNNLGKFRRKQDAENARDAYAINNQCGLQSLRIRCETVFTVKYRRFTNFEKERIEA